EAGLATQKAWEDRRRPSKKTRLKFRRAKERERGLRAEAGAAKPDLHTLHGFREVRLSPYERTPEVERFCGYGFRGDRPHLLVVEYPLVEGQRDENRHLVHSLPLEAFESFVDVAALSAYEPELVLEPRRRTVRAAGPSMERPRLDDFSDVFL